MLVWEEDLLLLDKKFRSIECSKSACTSTSGFVSLLLVTGATVSGKSELVRQYSEWLLQDMSRNFLNPITLVMFINAATPSSFESSLRLLAAHLGCLQAVKVASQFSNKKQQLKLLSDSIKYELMMQSGWLLIIDNLTNSTVEVALSYWPQTGAQGWGRGRVIITCSNEVASNSYSVERESCCDCKVGEKFTTAKCLALIRSITNIADEEEETVLKMIALIYNNPMALAAVAFSKCMSSANWWQCLESLERQISYLTEQELVYATHLVAALSVMVSAVIASNHAANYPLQFLAVCSEEPVPLMAVEIFIKSKQKRVDCCIEAIQKFPFVLMSLDVEGKRMLHLHKAMKVAVMSMSSMRHWLEIRLSILGTLAMIEDYLNGNESTRRVTQQMLPHLIYMIKSVACEQSLLSNAQCKSLADAWFYCGQCIDFLGADCSLLLNHLELQRECFNNALSLHAQLKETKTVQIARELLELGLVCDDLNLPLEGKSYLVRAVDVAKSTGNIGLIFRSLHVLGRIFLDLGDTNQAILCLEECLSLHNADIVSSVLRASVLTLLGRGYQAVGMCDIAESILMYALYLSSAAVGSGYFSSRRVRSQVLSGLGRLYLEPSCHKIDKATELLEESLHIRIDIDGYYTQCTALTLTGLGRIHLMKQEFDLAKLKLTAALVVLQQTLPADHSDTANALHILGNVEYRLGNLSEGIRLLQQSKAMKERVAGDVHPKITMFVSTDLGNAMLKSGRIDKALTLLLEALEAKRNQFGDYHVEVGIAYSCLHDVYRAAGDLQKASQCLIRSRHIMQVQSAKGIAAAAKEKKSLAQKYIDKYEAIKQTLSQMQTLIMYVVAGVVLAVLVIFCIL